MCMKEAEGLQRKSCFGCTLPLIQWDQSSPSNIADLIYLKYDGQNKIMRTSRSLDFPMLPPEL